jgi:hypothetical protein
MPVARNELSSTARQRGAPERRAWSAGRTADAVGVTLAVAAAGWVLVAAHGREGARPGPVIVLLVSVGAAAAVGRVVADRWSQVVHAVLAIAVAGAMVLSWPGPTSAGGPPLGYANANATLTALGVLAALQMAVVDRTSAGRRAWLGLAVGLGAATVAIGSVAGVLCLLAALAVVGLAVVTRSAVVATVGGAIAVVLVLGVTVAIARGADPAGFGERAELRGELWAAAADLAADEPARGVGPGRFEALNPVSDDADLRWAHHGYLQTAAETGAAGLGLLLALLGWAYIRLAITAATRPGVAVIGAAGLTVVALHATVDYVLHVPAVPLALAALIGASTSDRRRRPTPQQGRGSRG